MTKPGLVENENPETADLLRRLATAVFANEKAFANGHPDPVLLALVGRDHGYLFAEAFDEVTLRVDLERRAVRLLAQALEIIETPALPSARTARAALSLPKVKALLEEATAAEERSRPDPFALLAAIAAAHLPPATVDEPATMAFESSDYPALVHHLSEAMATAGAPLSEQQQLLLAGSLAMWLELERRPTPKPGLAP